MRRPRNRRLTNRADKFGDARRLDTAYRHVVICCRDGAGRPETTMNQTKPSNGPADVRLSAIAAAALDTLRRHDAPTRASMVYSATDAIPVENAWDLSCGATQTALRELIDAGLVVATERDGETFYSLAPEQPARPYTDRQRAIVLDVVRDCPGRGGPICTKAWGAFGLLTPKCGVMEILADLVVDGDVIREVCDRSYIYRLAPPPEPPLPTLSAYEMRWLRCIADNEPLRVTHLGEGYNARLSLVEANVVTDAPNNVYTLTDLGRRVLAAAEPSA